jgi:hypothetical protein
MRSELVDQVVHSFGVVRSRRAGLCVGLWGEPGIGKSFTAQTIVCKTASLPTLRLCQALPEKPIARTMVKNCSSIARNAEREFTIRMLGIAQVVASSLRSCCKRKSPIRARNLISRGLEPDAKRCAREPEKKKA